MGKDIGFIGEKIGNTEQNEITIITPVYNTPVEYLLDKVQRLYLCLIDSNDWVDEDFLEKLHDKALHDDADMVIGGYKKCDENENILSYVPKDSSALQNTYHQLVSMLTSRLIKTSVLKAAGLKYPETKKKCLVEDLPFNVFLCYYCRKISVLEEYGYNIRIHRQSISHNSFQYSRLNLDNMPIKYVENEIRKITFDFSDEKDRMIVGHIIMVLASLCCLWTRNSGKEMTKETSRMTGKLGRICYHSISGVAWSFLEKSLSGRGIFCILQ